MEFDDLLNEITPQVEKGLEQRKRLFPEPPPTEIKSLQDDEIREEVFNSLCSGVSPHRISAMLYQSRGIVIPPVDIRAYYDAIPEEYLLPASYLKKRLLQLDIKIDAIGEMQRLLAMADQRLGAALLAEELQATRDPQVDKMINDLWRKLVEFVEIQQSLGTLPKEAIPVDVRHMAVEQLPTLREILEQRKNTVDGEVRELDAPQEELTEDET